MEEMSGDFVTGVDEVVVDGLTITDDFCVSVRHHWDRCVRVQIDEWLLEVLLCHGVYLHEVYVSACNLTNSKECTSVLAEEVTPDLKFLGTWLHVL